LFSNILLFVSRYFRGSHCSFAFVPVFPHVLSILSPDQFFNSKRQSGILEMCFQVPLLIAMSAGSCARLPVLCICDRCCKKGQVKKNEVLDIIEFFFFVFLVQYWFISRDRTQTGDASILAEGEDSKALKKISLGFNGAAKDNSCHALNFKMFYKQLLDRNYIEPNL